MTNEWTIKSSGGTVMATVKELEYHGEWMGDEYVTVTVKSPTLITFNNGDYLEYRGQTFYINYDPNIIKKAKSGSYGEAFVYENIKFYTETRVLNDVTFKDYVLNDNGKAYSQQAKFSFFAGSVEDLADRIQANLIKAYGTKWAIFTPVKSRSNARVSAQATTESWSSHYTNGSEKGSTDVNVSCDGISCFAALKLAYDLFGLPFFISGTNIFIGANDVTIGYDDVYAGGNMRYGKGNGLYEIEANTDEGQQVVTKMYAYGSSDNMPLNYYANIGKKMEIRGVRATMDDGAGNTVYGIKAPSQPYYSFYPATNKGENIKLEYTNGSGNTYTALADLKSYVNGNLEACWWALRKDQNGADVAFYNGCADLTQSRPIYVVSGANINAWPAASISEEGTASYPGFLSISNLMLPGFPSEDLYSWVVRNGATNHDPATGRATWKGNTLYFSKDAQNPWIMSQESSVYGVREGAVYFDGSDSNVENIRPTIEGTGADVVSVGSDIEDNGYLTKTTNLSFKISVANSILKWADAWSTPHDEISISMRSGNCTGRSFKLLKKPEKKNGLWELKLERSKDSSLERYFPYRESDRTNYAQITAGNKFVVIGIQLPDEYITAAAERLLDAAIACLLKIDKPKVTYLPKIDELAVQRQRDTIGEANSFYYKLRAGMKLAFYDQNLFGGGQSRFIDTVTIKENGNNGIPTFDVVLRDEKEETFKQMIQNEISSMSGSGSGGSSGGGSSSSSEGGISEEEFDDALEEKVDNDWFSKLFILHGEKEEKKTVDGEEVTTKTDVVIDPNEWPESGSGITVKSIEAKYGFWTEMFISALGKNDEEGDKPFSLNKPLSTINDTAYFETHDPTEGDAIVYKNGTWQFGKAGSEGDTLKSDILKSINENTISPLGTLQNGNTVVYDGSKWKYGNVLNSVLKGINDNSASPGNLGEYGMLAYMGSTWKYTTMPRYLKIENSAFTDSSGKPYAADATIINGEFTVDISNLLSGYVTVDWFKKLFKVHTGANDAAGTEIEPNNDLPSGGFNIESLVGFWTKKYISALGLNGTSGTTLELNGLLSKMNEADYFPTGTGALTWNGTSWTFSTTGGIDEGQLATYLSQHNYITSDNAEWWGQTLNKATTPNSVSGDITVGEGSIFLNKGRSIYAKDSNNNRALMRLGTDNVLIIGSGAAEAGYNTYYYGNNLYFKYGTSTTIGMILNSSGNVGIGTSTPYSRLDVNGGVKAAKFYFIKPNADNDNGAIYLTYNNDSTSPGVRLVGGGFHADTYVSALGQNASSGGGGMEWEALTDYDNNPNHRIAKEYLSNVTHALTGTINGVSFSYDGTYGTDLGEIGGVGTFTSLVINGGSTPAVTYNPKNQQDATLTVSGEANVLTVTAATGSLTIALADGYGSTKNPYNAQDKNKVLAGPVSGSAALPIFRGLDAADMPDLSGTYATLADHFDASGNANSALKLTTGKQTLWGNIYWTDNGVPTSVGTSSSYASMDYVSGITMYGGLTMWEGSTKRHDFTISWNNDVLLMYAYESQKYWDMCIGSHTDYPTHALYLNASTGNWGVGTMMPFVKLHVNGDSYTSGKIYLYKDASNSDNDLYFERDGSSVKLHGNFYATGAVSALGSNTSGGGSIDMDTVWTYLGANDSSHKIDNSHLSLGTLTMNGETWNPADGSKSMTITAGDFRNITMASDGDYDNYSKYAYSYAAYTGSSVVPPTGLSQYSTLVSFGTGLRTFQMAATHYSSELVYRVIENKENNAWGFCDWRTIWHSGNFTPSEYLLKTDISDWAKASTKPTYKWDEIDEKPTTFTPPVASQSVRGGIMVGDTLAISNEVLNLASVTVGTPATTDIKFTKVVVDSYGRVTKATTLEASDIPDLSWNKITSDKPTTLGGYGISDAVKDSTTWWGQTLNKTTTPNSVSGDITVGEGSIFLNKGRSIYVKDFGNDRVLMRLGTDNILIIGSGSAEAGYTTNLYGKVINLKYGSSTQLGMTLDDKGNVGIGTAVPSVKLDVNGDIKTATGDGAYIQIGDIRIGYDYGNTALEVYRVDNEGNHVSANLYARGAVSALGSENSSGSVFDESRMWDALGSNTGTYGSTKINNSHLNLFGLSIITQDGTVTYNPATDSKTIDLSNMTGNYLPLTGGTLTLSSIDGFVIKRPNNQYGFIKFVGKVDNIADTVMGWLGVSGVDNPVFRNTAGNVYKLWHEGNNGHGGGIDADKLDGQHGSYYATASSVTTLEGYFTNGVANQAVNMNVRNMAVGDDYDTLSGYTAARGSFVAVNIDGRTSSEVTLDGLGAYDTLASFGYSLRTIQLKDSAYGSTLKYRHVVQPSSGVYSFSAWKTIAFTDSSITGNAATATKLAGSVNINGTAFDGSQSITTSKWGESRDFTIKDADSSYSGSAVSVNGSGNVTLLLPSTIKATLKGNADTATNLYDESAFTAWGATFFTGGKPTSISNTGLAGVDGIDFYGSNGVKMDTNGNIVHKTNTSGNYWHVDTKAGVAVLSVTAGGNVGIGTVSPATKLEVDGTIRTSGNLDLLRNGSGIRFYLDSSNNYVVGLRMLTGSNNLILGEGTSTKSYDTSIYGYNIGLYYGTSHNTGILVNSSGKVSIGSSVDSFITEKLNVNGNIKTSASNGSYIQIGDIRIVYDNTDNRNALKVVGSDGTSAANFYATGAVSALGSNTTQGDVDYAYGLTYDSSTGDLTLVENGQNKTVKIESGTNMDAVWTALATETSTNVQQIHPSHMAFADSRYLKLSGGTLTASTGNTPLTIKSGSTVADIQYCDKNDTILGYIGVSSDNKPYFKNGTSSYDILHTGNFKVGDHLSFSNSTLDLESGIVTAGTYRSVTVDTYGRVTAGTNPTTLEGYGITDAVKDDTKWWGKQISNGVVTGDITVGDGSIYLNKGRSIYVKDSSNYRSLMRLGTDNVLIIGSGAAEAGYNTYYYGNNLYFKYGTSTTTGMILSSSGSIGIGSTSIPNNTKLYVSGNIRATEVSWFPSLELYASTPYIDFHKGMTTPADTPDYTTRLIESSAGILSLLAKDSNNVEKIAGLVIGNSNTGDYIQIGGAKLTWTANGLECDRDFYSKGAVSALGSGSSGGGSMGDFSAIVNSLNQSSTAVGTGFLYSNGGAWSFQSTSSFWKTSDFSLKTALSVFGDYDNHGATNLGWIGDAEDDAKVVTSSMLAYWDGCFSGTSSNLTYCNRGAFGTIVTKNAGDYVALDSNNNATVSGTLYLNQNSNNYIYGSTTQSGAYYMTLHGYSGVNIESNLWVDTMASIGAEPNNNYTLYVNGDEYISDGLYFYGNSSSGDDNSVYIEDYYYSGVRFLRINAFGGLFVNSTNYSSDMRKKNVVHFIDNLSVDSIALAPIFDFTWKESKDNLQHVGTSAQYWQNVLPNSVVDMGEFGLSLDYNAITIASAVITARKVVDHELRIKELEKENEILRTEIEQLKAA